jgi:hypothetical protein
VLRNIPWIDKLLSLGVKFNDIRVLGGEPFLHSNLEKVVRTLKDRYSQYGISIETVTNGFWLGKIEKWSGVLSVLDKIYFSRYEDMVKKVVNFDSSIADIVTKFPSCKVEVWDMKVHHSVSFSSQPEKMGESDSCMCSWSTSLTTEGKLYRCPIAAFAKFNPFVTSEFLNAIDESVVYDIDGNKSVEEWMLPRTFAACSYCDMWKRDNLREVVFSPEKFLSIAKGK